MQLSGHYLKPKRSAKPRSVSSGGRGFGVVCAQPKQVARVQDDLLQLASKDVGQGGQHRGLLGSRRWLRLQARGAGRCV